MKKSLIVALALIFVLGIASTAFAAASDADNAKELADLKARVAAMEKSLTTVKADKSGDNKVSFKGSDFRIRWWNKQDAVASSSNGYFEERIRLNMTYTVNPDIKMNIRWRVLDENRLGTNDVDGSDNQNTVTDANMAIKNLLGQGTTTTVGRYGQTFGATGYWNSTTVGFIDGIKVAGKIDKLSLAAGFANFGAFNSNIEDAYWVNAIYAASKATNVYGMRVDEVTGAGSNYDVWGVGLKTKINDDFSFRGDYMINYGRAGNPEGSYLRLDWKDADVNEPGSFGMQLHYRNIKNGNMFSSTGTSSNIPTYGSYVGQGTIGYKGPAISAHYAVAKNVLLEGFQTFKTKNAGTGQAIDNYSRLCFIVSF